MLDLSGRNVLVLGLGVSGASAARFCCERGANVVAADEGTPGGLEDLPAAIERVVGRPLPDAADFDLVVPSPGVPPARYAKRAQRVWGDVELAFRALAVPIVAVTGTNGKSTTTRLIERMLRGSGFRARAAGNVGEPALELVGEPLDVAVLEVSSFQLETTESFRPRVAVILNLTPDHLDRHGSFDAYREAKARILAHQRSEDTAILNGDDPVVRGLAERARGRVVFFRASQPSPALEGRWLRAAHERENVLAALAATRAAGADAARAVAALEDFEPLPHRMEAVGCKAGVDYVNDSKATNPGAALRSLESCGGPVVWIAGGRDKGLDFAQLAEVAAARLRAAVLIGEAAGKLKDALAGRVETHAAAHLEEAVRCAARLARPGDVVLLAPACASQDQFRDFEERGERFRAAVAALASEREERG